MGLQSIPEGRCATRDELVRELAADVLPACGPERVRRQRRPLRQHTLDRVPVDRHGDGAQTHHRRARVSQGRRDRRAKAVVDRADEQDGDPFALEPRRHHGVVRTGDELRIGRVFLNGAFQLVDLTPGTREIVLQVATLGVAESVRGERDSDKNPDHEREEDGRKGRDVVAKVEHAATFSLRSGSDGEAWRACTHASTGGQQGDWWTLTYT